jgi:hypothetical protein
LPSWQNQSTIHGPGGNVFPRERVPEPVAFRVEEELREPLASWLLEEGFTVWNEVPILGRRADLFGSRGGTVIAVELKMNRWAQALRQAIAYQLAADRVWVAMPLAAASRAYRQRWLFEAEGVGLLAVDENRHVRVPIRAQPSPRLLPFVQEGVLSYHGALDRNALAKA